MEEDTVVARQTRDTGTTSSQNTDNLRVIFFLSYCAMLDTHKQHIKIRVYDTESGVIGLSITTNLGNVVEMIVDGPSFRKWMGGELIQRCFPEMDVELRELLISGMDMETQEEFFCDGD
jgi:hypothetical protein